MNKEIMQFYIRACLNMHGLFECRDARILLLDSFVLHKDDAVKESLVRKSIVPVYIPPKTTSFLQPLDILINSIFKASMKRYWAEWASASPHESTKSGY
ncbi:hypothetical protein ENBRE01_1826 [Enteropsectra breve]|nr:hypothetical protein ENBRE01_1826 [Enteropsectra breve]